MPLKHCSSFVKFIGLFMLNGLSFWGQKQTVVPYLSNWWNKKAKHTHTTHLHCEELCSNISAPRFTPNNIFSGINSSFNEPNVILLFLRRVLWDYTIHQNYYMICIYETVVEMTVRLCFVCPPRIVYLTSPFRNGKINHEMIGTSCNFLWFLGDLFRYFGWTLSWRTLQKSSQITESREWRCSSLDDR